MGGVSSVEQRLFSQIPDHDQEPIRVPCYADGTRLRSLSAVAKAGATTFTNCTPYLLELFWLNYRGNAVSYGQIHANTQKRIETFLTHPWICRAVHEPEQTSMWLAHTSTGQQVLCPSLTPSTHTIHVVLPVAWSPVVHASHFSAASQPMFNQELRTLLLVHHRLRNASHPHPPKASPVSPAAPGCGPCMSYLLRSRAPVSACIPPPTTTPEGLRPNSNTESPATRGKGLAALPLEVCIKIIGHMAPRVPDIKPILPSDMEMPPEDLAAAHATAVEMIAAHLQALEAEHALAAVGVAAQGVNPVLGLGVGPDPDDQEGIEAEEESESEEVANEESEASAAGEGADD